MDPQSIINIAIGLLVVIFGLTVVNLYLILRYKEIDPFAKWNPNQINGAMFFGFYIIFILATAITWLAWDEHFSLVFNAASEHGVEIDRMFWNTMMVTILVVVLTNGLLFYYSWRYRSKPGRKALYYPHNNKLEYLWTAVPAVVMALLIFDGLTTWHDIMGDPPEDAIQVEVNGKQFEWTVRYPGEDLEFGETSVGNINVANSNTLGFDFADKRGHDDVITTEIHLPVGVPVNLNIKSIDVLHSATLAHFRVKMDAVPGMPTNFHFTPTVTTAEMRAKTGNPDFNYQMSCQQICGGGHWNMGRVVVVETMEEYQRWLASQKPFYASWKEINPTEAAAIEEELAKEAGSISMNK